MVRRFILAALLIFAQTASLVAAPIRGRAFDVYFQLTNISDGADVTSGTVTVKVSKDGAAQATATNSASHLGQGQWKVTLTATEMNAASVGVSAAESGSYTVNQTIVTEPARPTIRKVFKYDGALSGDLLGTFSRSVATVDGAGLPVAANERRFDGTTRAIAGLCDWHATPYVAGTTPYLMASGEDLDGDLLLVINETASSTIRVVEIDDERLTASEVSRTAYTALPGAGGSITMAPRSAQVISGTIIIQSQRNNSTTVTGMALAYSQNNGSSWTAISTAAADGGGDYMPAPASYSTSADANNRGGFWSTSWTPHGGLDAAGRPKSMNRVWLTNWDYLHGAATAKGYDGGVVELTRDSDDEHYTVGVNRRLLSGYSTSYTNNLHIHMLGMTGSGVFVAAMGDSNGKENIRAITIDLDDYAAATPTVTEIFGELAASGTAGRMAPQIFGGVPGPDGKILCSNDTWLSPVLAIDDMASASSAFVLDSPHYMQDDNKTGDYYRGWENFNLRWFPDVGWITGPDATKNVMRLFSRDGRNWAILNATDGLTGQSLIVGNCLATIHDSSDTLYLCKLPEVRTRRPLMVAPGGDNYVNNDSAENSAVAPTAPNTRRRVLYSGGRYIFADDSTAVPNAPKVPPPFNDAVLYYLGNQSAASYDHGWIYLPASGDTATIGANYVGVTCALANLGSNATGWSNFRVGSDGIGNNCTTFQGFKPDRSANAKNSWTYSNVFGNPVNDPASSRTLMQLLSGPSSGTANKDCPMLVAVGGLYVTSTGITPWPTPRDSTSNPNEYEALAVPISPSASSAWKGTVSLIRSDTQATIGSSLPSGTLCVWKRDANNYITIALDGPNWEIDVISTVNGSTADTESIAIEDWLRGTPLNISVTDDGAGNVYASLVSARNGIQQTTNPLTSSSIGYPTQFLASNADASATYNIMVAGGEIQDQYLTYEQMRAEHVSLSYLDTDADKTASTVSAKVDEQLEYAFSRVPADVWLESLPTKSGTTGMRLSRIPDAAAGGANGLPTVDANNRIAGLAGTLNTLDQLDTAQDAQHALTKGDTAATRTLAEGANGFAAIKTDAAAAATQASAANAVVSSGTHGNAALNTDIDTMTTVLNSANAKLGTPSTTIAGDIAAKPTAAQIRTELDANSTKLANLDAAISTRATNAGAASAVVAETPPEEFFENAPSGGEGGASQPRINRKPDPGFTIQVSRRSDGTYKCTKPIRLTAGAIDQVYVFIDMSPLFGVENFVQNVGTAVVSAGDIEEGDDNGPRDTYAVLELDGTADEDCTITVPVTMTSGTTVPVVFDVEVLGE